VERLLERVQDPFRRRDRSLWDGGVLQQDSELVASKAGSRVGWSYACTDALRRSHEQLVTRGVAEAVVHRLEIIEIQEQDRDAPTFPSTSRQRVLDPIDEQSAVGELGERIVEGLPLELDLHET
jgi:hypothetical protein